jgi:hypothetical protein
MNFAHAISHWERRQVIDFQYFTSIHFPFPNYLVCNKFIYWDDAACNRIHYKQLNHSDIFRLFP